ncbi:flavin-nucleotide-binding protein [Bifidobacterium sp. SMB2]|uniref:Flavin-nucleotide-binding protein n=1 Tax=Bifidobacterium saimiriisciurei TaxID=2661627 RepID=A0ABX0C8U2_9BIFI|nr:MULTISPECIES: pyridoxamine 5'-phosphate oxidase family protein [Bifidobacterium]NEG96912.1 flavin-nucleotide-binding protein [Bifidobacterium sp. SMB2]NEH11558.1 flavin-nucleotide-binding protein [Bifidobacterium saimiriisciurei]
MSVGYAKENDGAGRVRRRENERTIAGAHRMMRRADREVTDADVIASIIDGCDIADVAYTDAEGLTVVPVNFGYEYDRGSGRLVLWMHSAPHGRKLDAIRAAGNRLPVAFAMRTDCEVVEGRTACNWGESFKSVVGNGVASIVDDLDECRHGMQLLMAHQAHMPHVEFTDAQVRSVTVWKIESEYLTAKVRPKPAPTHAHAHGGHHAAHPAE